MNLLQNKCKTQPDKYSFLVNQRIYKYWFDKIFFELNNINSRLQNQNIFLHYVSLDLYLKNGFSQEKKKCRNINTEVLKIVNLRYGRGF